MNGKHLIRAGSILLLTTWLVACGGSSGGGDDDEVVAFNDLNGDWTSGCFVDAPFSVKLDVTFNDNNVTVTETEYADAACSMPTTVKNETSSFTLGGAVSLDGSVAGITSATKIDITSLSDPGDTDYDLIAIKDDTLYLGDDSGANDGSTPELRPTQLDGNFILTRI